MPNIENNLQFADAWARPNCKLFGIVPLSSSISWPHLKYQWKRALIQKLQTSFQYSDTAPFCHHLLTGEGVFPITSYLFASLGLQHLLAISGFHFAFLLGLFASILTSCQIKYPHILLALLASFYFLFLGDSASITRSYLFLLYSFLTRLYSRPFTAINGLGFCLLISLYLDPMALYDLSFQFSYLATLGLVSTFPRYLKNPPVLPFRNLPFWTLHIRLFAHILRHHMKMNFRIIAFLLPALAHHFALFPWVSLVYNLFVPFWVLLILASTLTSLTLSLLDTHLSHGFFQVTETLTQTLFFTLSHPPLIPLAVPLPSLSLLSTLLLLFGLLFATGQKDPVDVEWTV
jgi:competence protein ComEC